MKRYAVLSSYLAFSSPLHKSEATNPSPSGLLLVDRAHLGHIPGDIPFIILLINDMLVVLKNKTKTSGSESPIWMAWVPKWLMSTLLF